MPLGKGVVVAPAVAVDVALTVGVEVGCRGVADGAGRVIVDVGEGIVSVAVSVGVGASVALAVRRGVAGEGGTCACPQPWIGRTSSNRMEHTSHRRL